MAIYPKKSKDPTEVALSAIQDALNVRDTDAPPPMAATIATAAEASSESRKRVPRVAPINREAPVDTAVIAPQDDREIVQAANDDQESIGQILQSMQRTPKGVSFFVATAFSVIWAFSALGLMIWFWGSLRGLDWITFVPIFIGIIGSVFAPIALFYAVANMLARSQELRMVAHSMAEATLRFAEPDTLARDSVVTVGQAIRREVAAMGDGVER